MGGKAGMDMVNPNEYIEFPHTLYCKAKLLSSSSRSHSSTIISLR